MVIAFFMHNTIYYKDILFVNQKRSCIFAHKIYV
jgi:hypothetical protein